MTNSFKELFPTKAIIGMIHLAGDTPIERAIEELKIYENEGLNGAIIEDHHYSDDYVVQTLEAIEDENIKLAVGVSILGNKSRLSNEFRTAMKISEVYKTHFVKLDYVTGRYKEGDVPLEEYLALREKCPNTQVLAGVHPKYFTPLTNLEDDLKNTMPIANAIIVSESEMGVEVPLEKIKNFRKTIENYPLIVGGGLTAENTYERLSITEGAIIGTSLKKDRNTRNPVDIKKVKEIMRIIESLR